MVKQVLTGICHCLLKASAFDLVRIGPAIAISLSLARRRATFDGALSTGASLLLSSINRRVAPSHQPDHDVVKDGHPLGLARRRMDQEQLADLSQH